MTDDPAPRNRETRRAPRRIRRLRHHLALGAVSLVATAAVFALVGSDDPLFRASMATAYVALGLLAVTLAFGPVAALRGHRYPVSTDIRRDVGIWSGIVGLAHVVVGLQVHLRGKMWEYFVGPVNGVLLPRIDPFGAANYAGAAAALILLVLLITSNDASLRRLGSGRWRGIHALTAWALVLTLLHGAAYQFVEKRPWAWVLGFTAMALTIGSIRLSRALHTRW